MAGEDDGCLGERVIFLLEDDATMMMRITIIRRLLICKTTLTSSVFGPSFLSAFKPFSLFLLRSGDCCWRWRRTTVLQLLEYLRPVHLDYFSIRNERCFTIPIIVRSNTRSIIVGVEIEAIQLESSGAACGLFAFAAYNSLLRFRCRLVFIHLRVDHKPMKGKREGSGSLAQRVGDDGR